MDDSNIRVVTAREGFGKPRRRFFDGQSTHGSCFRAEISDALNIIPAVASVVSKCFVWKNCDRHAQVFGKLGHTEESVLQQHNIASVSP